MLRYARYVAAVVFALLAAGLVGLWVRSYSYTEGVNGPIGDHYFAGIEHGCGLIIGDLSRWPNRPASLNRWHWPCSDLGPLDIESLDFWRSETALRLGFIFRIRPRNGFAFSLPHWFAVAFCTVAAGALAFLRNWRFSLRGLLIVTTLLAAIFGLAVYAV